MFLVIWISCVFIIYIGFVGSAVCIFGITEPDGGGGQTDTAFYV